MARYAGELVPGGVSMGAGIVVPPAPITNGGYPVAVAAPGMYPNSPLAATTVNKSGIPNSPDEKTVAVAATAVLGPAYSNYSWKTWEEKAAVTIPAGVFATVSN
jgi:hypothetical protein